MLSNIAVTAAMPLIAELPKHSKKREWDVVDGSFTFFLLRGKRQDQNLVQ